MKIEKSTLDSAMQLRKAGLVIRNLKDKLQNLEQSHKEKIAIIGIGCRFPGGANTPEQFWELLSEGRDAIVDVPSDRWDIDAYYDPDPDVAGKMAARQGGFLADVDGFEPQFFGISPREAISMDPQQRLLLEVTWETLESANIVPDTLFNSQTGVFIGICGHDYQHLIEQGDYSQHGIYSATGNASSVAAGRLSYTLGLTGPCVAIDTACSSSLVAVHQACQSLRNRECNLALTGGVNLILSPEYSITFSNARMLSPDSRCKTFDAAANGFVRGEGCGLIALKRLSDAEADGDTILAVIGGSMTNQDGRSSGLTAPSGPSQQSVIRQALANAGITPDEVSYIEAHGTGTSLGDPIEIGALNALFAERNDPLWVGSVKTNIGHLEGAAGISGLIKVVLAMGKEEIPPHLHLNTPNPYIDWQNSPVQIPMKSTPWLTSELSPKRIAGVSSFGFGGTNAHVVLEEAPLITTTESDSKIEKNEGIERPYHLLNLSAKSESALQSLAQHYSQLLTNCSTSTLANIGYSANLTRTHFDHRLSIVADSATHMQQKLATYFTTPTLDQSMDDLIQGHVTRESDDITVAFLFTGQGAQYIQMGRDLYETQPTFRAMLDHCDALLQEHLAESVLEALYPEPKSLLSKRIDQTEYTQPALFVLEYALAQLWQSWGIQPDILIGHSVGEIVAACVANVFSLEDGLKLIAARGRLMGSLPQGGAMVSLLADESWVKTKIAPYKNAISIAAVNGPKSVVISGEREAVHALAEECAAQGIKTRSLAVSHAFHSSLMEPMLDEFYQVAATINYQQPQRQLVSNLTGKLAGAEIMTPDYWVRHVRESVRFADGVATLLEQNVNICLEIGPKPTLLGMAGQIFDMAPEPSPVILPSLREGRSDWQQMLESLAALYVQGVQIDWAGFDQGYERTKITLPTYPFQRKRYWIDTENDRRETAESGQSAFATWLEQTDIIELTQRIAHRANLADDDGLLVTKVLESLTAEHESQQLNAKIDSLLYEMAWESQTEPLSWAVPTQPGKWLILADDGGVGSALAQQLIDLGQEVECLEAASIEDILTRLDELTKLASEPEHTVPLQGVIYLWHLNAKIDENSLDIAMLEQMQQANLENILRLLQNLIRAFPGSAPSLWATTYNTQQVLKTQESPTLEGVLQAPIWGLGRVAASEHPDHWGGLIDFGNINSHSPEGSATQQATHLLHEILKTETDHENQIAYRQGVRYVARLVQSDYPLPTADDVGVQHDATYLITGGLGPLGLVVGQWLAEQGAGQLILTGRRGVYTDEQQATIDAITALGTDVQIAAVDVADEKAMNGLFSKLCAGQAQDDKPLKGIFHTAGVLDDAILLNQSWERFATVMNAKVTGSWLLHSLVQQHNLDLDVFILFSSTSALLGIAGQSNYAAANTFMDALASYRQQQGLAGLSINWGAWAKGMAARTTAIQADKVQMITPEEGMLALERLWTNQGQITVAPMDWEHIAKLTTKPSPFLSNWIEADFANDDTSRVSLIQELEALPASRRPDYLQHYLQQLIARILGMSDLPDRDTGFAEMGMDSLMALELKKRLDSALGTNRGIALPTTLAFEYPTADSLAEYLLTHVLALAEATPLNKEPSAAVSAKLNEPIAVISIGCRFPGADTPDSFWQLLEQGVDMVGQVPPQRWDVDEYYDPQRPMPGKMYTREGAFVDGVDQFDPIFFGISPREAIGMDPQQRLLLEITWETLERAGLPPHKLVGSSTGVFVGIGSSDYGALAGVHDFTELDTHSATSSGHSIAAGRLAYTLGLQGPAVAIDTACSSSLVALHMACQSLQLGECNLVLAGGVSLMLSAVGHVALSQMQALAPDGRCKTFDVAADGYGRGEGGSMVLLKRLSDAVADGDEILAVIQGSATNHDGRSSGLTVPNKQAQEKVVRQALANAHIAPDEVAYVEAHGTGTPLGDPIEIRALGAVFGAERETPLLVGSVKTNVGHLEAAAGMAGFVKAVLAIRHGQIPPHLHYSTPNPYIEWDEFAIDIPTVLQSWPMERRVAGISSFGISGTNAHIIVVDAPKIESDTQPDIQNVVARTKFLLPLSAKNSAALSELTSRYTKHIQTHPELDFNAFCSAAATGRNHFNQRLAIVAENHTDFLTKWAAMQQGEELSSIMQNRVGESTPHIAFLFTGQGSQYVGMGRELYATEPIFREVMDRCDGIMQQHLGRSLLELIYPEQAVSGNSATVQPATLSPDLMESHPCGQAANFAIECALVDLWRSWGVTPDVVLGHSLGDFAAAYTAGVLTVEEGLALVIERGRLMETAQGEMVSVLASESEILPFIAVYDDVVIGVINGPQSVVISGGSDHVRTVTEQLQAAGFKTRKVAVPMAAHSPLLDPVLDDFEAAVRDISLSSPKLTVISSMTGQPVTDELTDPTYWRKHLRNTVRFTTGAETMLAQGIDICIEIGPKPTLLALLNQQPITNNQLPINLPSLRENQDAGQQMLESLGQLYVTGVEIDWDDFARTGSADNSQQQKIMLPTYPFQRERYWVDIAKSRKIQHGLRPLINKMIRLPLQSQTVFETEFNVTELAFLADHKVFGEVISPGACQLSMVLSAAELTYQHQACTLTDIVLPQALVIPSNDGQLSTRTVQAIFTPEPSRANGHGSESEFKLISFDQEMSLESEPATHVMGTVLTLQKSMPDTVDIAALRQRCDQADTDKMATFYSNLRQSEIDLGDSFQWLSSLWRSSQGTEDRKNSGESAAEYQAETLAQIRLPETVRQTAGYLLHPGLLDACFQVAALTSQDESASDGAMLPFAIGALHLYRPAVGTEWWCHAIQIDSQQWNVQLLDSLGQVVAEIEHFEGRSATAEMIRGHDVWREWLYEVTWQPKSAMGLRPHYLSALSSITKILQDRVPTLLADNKWECYQRATHDLEALSIDYVLAAFAKVGVNLTVGTRLELASLAQRLGVIPQYHRLLRRLFTMLAEEEFLQQEGDTWVVCKTPIQRNPAATLLQVRENSEIDLEIETTLLARCGENLSEVLRGVQEPLELLFPDGDASLTRHLYTETATARVMNGLLEEALVSALDALPAHQGIRILEIGAGTGSTTASLLPHLPAEQTEYLFTDIGATFLAQARENFSDYDFIHYQILDIEQSPAEQGFALQQADVVIAANVLHATQDLHQSLTHVRQLLKPGGMLFLLEGTQPNRFVDLIFGLTDGWWRFADLRQHHPLLAESAWQEHLLDAGFADVIDSSTQVMGQSVIVAQANQEVLPLQQTWLIFADSVGIGESLAQQLRQQGDTPILVYPGSAYGQQSDFFYKIDPDQAEDYGRLLEHISASNVQGIVYLWGLNGSTERACGSLLHLAQTLLTHEVESSGLWLVTQNAQAVSPTDFVTGVVQSPLWGMGKVIALEHPELNCQRIDLDDDPTGILVTQLWAELSTLPLNNAIEDQVAFRNADRFVARLAQYPVDADVNMALPAGPYQLDIDERGTLESLSFNSAIRRPPAAGEIEVQVLATGLNFRDVLNVLGLYPGDPGAIGLECSGIVVAVGEDVNDFQVGDRVMGMTIGCFQQYVTDKANLFVQTPECLCHEEAATIPSAFVTAYYGLSQLANIKAGDRVLVHAATGGVGQAAVQIAQQMGAEVYGTASPAKWDQLRSLGVNNVYNSRTLDFAEQILADTNGQGVDILLNSLTGNGFIEANLAALATNGRFIEISKRDIWTQEQLAAVRPDIFYVPFDLSEVTRQQPDLMLTIFNKIRVLLDEKRLTPLPQTLFPLQQVGSALRYMQQARHTGKIVITHPVHQDLSIRENATYLITGGMGGIGLEVAEWFVEQGAKHLILMGRSQPRDGVQQRVEMLRANGVSVIIAQADVTDLAQLQAVINQIDPAAPLRGLIHSVGVLDDGVLLQQDWTRFAKVFAPKIEGAWHLHTLTKDMPLDFFVLFSSGASLLGSRGQANHAGANAFLDAFAHYRQAQHLPALSINWGAWAEVGAAAELVRSNQIAMAEQGQGVIAPALGMAAFDHLFRQNKAQVGVMPIIWSRYIQHENEGIPPFYTAFIEEAKPEAATAETVSLNLLQQLEQADEDERTALLMSQLQNTAAKVLGMQNPAQIDPEQGLLDMGLDSLMAIELRNNLSNLLTHRLPSTLIFDYPTINALSDYIRHHVLSASESGMAEEVEEIERAPVAYMQESSFTAMATENLEEISEDEISDMLLAKLEQLGV